MLAYERPEIALPDLLAAMIEGCEHVMVRLVPQRPEGDPGQEDVVVVLVLVRAGVTLADGFDEAERSAVVVVSPIAAPHSGHRSALSRRS